MAAKDDVFEYKYLTANQIDAYAAFGWRKELYAPTILGGKKKRETLYSVRRRKFVGNDPVISQYEQRYTKLEKKKMKQRPFWGIVTFLLMLVFLVATVAELWIGLGDFINKERNFRVMAIYNLVAEEEENYTAIEYTAAEDEEETEEDEEEEEESEEGEENNEILSIPSTYYEFRKANPTLDNFVEAVQYIGQTYYADEYEDWDETDYEDWVEKYTQQLIALKAMNEASELASLDATAKRNEAGEYISENDIITTILDYPRQYISGNIDFDETLSQFGWAFLTTPVVIGVVSFILYVVFLIIFCRIATIPSRKKKCATEMTICLDRGEYAYNALKQNNRSLMNASERKAYDMQAMIARAIRMANED